MLFGLSLTHSTEMGEVAW